MNSIYVSRGLANNMLPTKIEMSNDECIVCESTYNNTKTKALMELLPTTIEVSNDESTDNNTKMKAFKESLMGLLNTDADVMRLIRDTIMEVMEHNDMLEAYNLKMFNQARNRLLSTDADCIRVPRMFSPLQGSVDRPQSRCDPSLDDVSEIKIPALSPE
jgi:hypothetical protein